MSTQAKGRADYYDDGDYNAVCYECGRKRKASTLMLHWQGYYVCPEHWEARHPQDFVRGVPDEQTPPWTQPMPADVFVPQTWTRNFTDLILLSDAISKKVGKDANAAVEWRTRSALNGRALNTAAINDPDLADGNPEGFAITESYYVGTDGALSDTITMSESTTQKIISTTCLNGAALNVTKLG